MGAGTNAMLDRLGTPPINPALFFIAKVALVVIVFAPVAQLAGVPVARPVPGLLPLAALAALSALVLFAFASRALGRSLRMGLPAGDTELKTSGVYRISRHPIYVAMFLVALAASLCCPHPVVLVSSVLVVVLHHRIALAEEAFLERRFGRAWLAHKARVPRYLGLPRG
jgi:protein-S-isoprenylcysteine O-methyltransferase Ste14